MLILCLNFFVYWKTLGYEFVCDDWSILRSLAWRGTLTAIIDSFLPLGQVLYRPLGWAYFSLIYQFFQLNPLPFHIIAIILHSLNALLAAAVVESVVADSMCAVFVGIMYAVASRVHIDTLSWLAGYYDLGAALFYLLSILLFVRRRPLASAAAFACSLLTKEATVAMPAILFCVEMLRDGDTPGRSRIRGMLLHLAPHTAVLIAYMVLRMYLASPGALEHDSQFRVQLLGSHVMSNLLSYLVWGVELIFPFRISLATRLQTGEPVRTLILALFVVVSVIFLWRSVRQTTKGKLPAVVFWSAWILLALIPVVFLPNHLNQYLFTYALVPFLGLAYSALVRLCRMAKLSRGPAVTAVLVLMAADLCASVMFVNAVDRGYYNEQTDESGIWPLARLSRIAGVTKDYFLRTHPALPEHSTIIGDCSDPKAFFYSFGPQVWYHDTTIHYVDFNGVRKDSGGYYVHRSIYGKLRITDEDIDTTRVYLSEKDSVLFVYFENEIHEMSIREGMKRSAAADQ